MSVPAILVLACVVITLVAAITDARTGHIPNWLTLPPLVVGPLAWTHHGGLWNIDGSLVLSVLSALVCSLVPWILFRKAAIGAGDVKLFAAVGALGLLSLGIEAQFYSFCAGSLFAMARLAWEGRLFRTLGNTVFLALDPVLPRKWRRPMTRELMTKMRFGAAIFVGTFVAALANNRLHGWL